MLTFYYQPDHMKKLPPLSTLAKMVCESNHNPKGGSQSVFYRYRSASENFFLTSVDSKGQIVKKANHSKDEARLPACQRHQVDTYLRLYHQLKEHMDALTEQIRQAAAADPRVHLRMTIPDYQWLLRLYNESLP